MNSSQPFGFDPGRPVAVYGLGGSGQATVAALTDHGLQVWAFDDHDPAFPPELSNRPQVHRSRPKVAAWPEFQALIKAPGIAMTAPAVTEALDAGVPVLSEIDLLWRRERGQDAIWLGITGTNGKSTTTALIGHILREIGKRDGFQVAVGGNLGIPALNLPSVGPGGFYVLELSSYQLEMIRELQADGAVFLNLTPDHLERHGTMAAYRDVKAKLLTMAHPNATCVLGTDQPILQELAATLLPQRPGLRTVATDGQSDTTHRVAGGTLWHGSEALLDVADLPNLPGPHNAQNVLAAAALLVPRWVSPEDFLTHAQTFQGLPHRLERITSLQGVTFINDSKATNADSAEVALKSFPNIYWICGGRPKSDGLGNCVQTLANVRAAFTIGEAGPDFCRAIEATGTPAFCSRTLERAVQEAFLTARTEGVPNPVVLLAPAAASQDQFRNYEHRGDVFVNAIRQLAETLAGSGGA